MKLVIATNNNHKLHEYGEMLSPYGIEVISPKSLGINCDPDENGKTFEENSLIKAKAIANLTKLPVLADDSGLCVKALNGFPGIITARFAKENGGNKIANLKLIELLKPHIDKSADFVCVITLIKDDKVTQFKGICDGYILDKPEGDGGFGYDPIFYSNQAKICFGVASEEIKNKYSHRYLALNQLIKYLKENKLIS